MKVLIVYASKTGTTKKCANILANELNLNCDCTLCDLSNSFPSINNYDMVVIGSSIRMGALNKKVVSFISKNETKLLNKDIGLFICNGFIESKDQILNNVFSQRMLKHAIVVDSFGGEFNFNSMKGLDKIITSKVVKNIKPAELPHILQNNIKNFALQLQK